MEKWDILLVLLCVLVTVFYTAVLHWKNRRQMKRLNEMLDLAISGKFLEKTFDETELSKLETKLAEYLRGNAVTQERLEKERNRIKTMISDISHQTKTPIANLCLYGDLLLEQKLLPEAEDYCNQMVGQAQKLQFLIDSLVKLSRLETGIVRTRPQKQSIAPMLEEIRKNYLEKAHAKGIMLLMEVASCEAVFDAKWTGEALSNLVDNAIKYTERGEVRVSVRKFEMFVAIDVADTGIGVEESEQAEIFGRFYRGRKARSQEGVGIGLFLAREIVAAQGGYIKLVSNKCGSTFSVFLPLG